MTVADMQRRTELTRPELEAINIALASALSGPLDGFDEGSADDRRVVGYMQSAQAKVIARLGFSS